MPVSPPSFKGLRPASDRASRAATASSRKRDTRCEIVLRRHLWALGLRYRVDAAELPGRPDLVFARAKVVVFCDGDFWHGRDLEKRLERLAAGHNAAYWVGKVTANVARDQRNADALRALGWHVVRVWEGDIKRAPAQIAERIAREIRTSVVP